MKHLLWGCLTIFIFSGIKAQVFHEVLKIQGFEEVNKSSVAYADVDGDQDQDVFIIGKNYADENTANLYINDGTGIYTKQENSMFEGMEKGSCHFVDIDTDGDQDLFVAGKVDTGYLVQFYYNNGLGRFREPASENPFEDFTYAIVDFSDVENDGDSDMLIIGSENNCHFVKIYINDGAGQLTPEEESPFSVGFAPSFTFVDMNGDGFEDILYVSNTLFDEPSSGVYLNDGTGKFDLLPNNPLSDYDYNPGKVYASDIDGDDDQDIFLFRREDVTFFINEGDGSFTERKDSTIRAINGGSALFFDADNDEDEDLICIGRKSVEYTTLYLNDGTGTFEEYAQVPFKDKVSGRVVPIDIDNDGDEDILISGERSLVDLTLKIAEVFENKGNLLFRQMSDAPFEPMVWGALAFADIDSDDDQDLFLTGQTIGRPMTRLYYNDGSGRFFEWADTVFSPAFLSATLIEDLDGDEDMDIIITGKNYRLGGAITRIYLNDGAGQYVTSEDTTLLALENGSISTADIDGDGDLDLLMTGEDEDNQSRTMLYLGDGIGNFTPVLDHDFINVGSSHSGFADIDGDGDQDLLITGNRVVFGSQYTTRLYANDGSGNFVLRMYNAPFWALRNGDFKFADVNGDGAPDALFTGSQGFSTSNPKTQLWLNDGVGGFSLVENSSLEGVRNSAIDFTDIDNDGDLDLFLLGYNSESESVVDLYLNDGNGNFTKLAGTPFTSHGRGAITTADVDNDQDIDVVISSTLSTKLYLNQGIGTNVFFIESTNLLPFTLSPNPVGNNTVFVRTDLDPFQDIQLLVYDINGKLIRQKALRTSYEPTFGLNTQGLVSGTYIVRVVAGEKSGTRKLIIR